MPTLHNISNDMYTAGHQKCLAVRASMALMLWILTMVIRFATRCQKNLSSGICGTIRAIKDIFCPEPMTAMINSPNLSLPNEVSGYEEITKGHTFKCWQRFFTE